MNKRTALITGGAQGIGYACAKLFVQRGYNVAILDINEDRKEEVLQELSAIGPVHYVVCDVTQTQTLDEKIQEVLSGFDTLDVLVNNASVGGHDDTLSISEERWDSYMSIALKSMFFVAQKAGAIISKTSSFGSIVNLSSYRANVADGTHLLYSTAKGGIAAMTRELAFTLGKDNIRVNAVLPGYIHTDMTDHYLHQKGMKEHILYHSALPNLLTAEDVARVIYFLCDTENTAISGQCIAVDAGMNVFAAGINKEETK